MTSENSYDLLGNINIAEPEFGIQVQGGILRTHPASLCSGEFCTIHNPSDHPLKEAALNWRGDRGMMERICKHGVGHPDPDDLDHKRRTLSPESFKAHAFAVHGCDRCCVPELIS